MEIVRNVFARQAIPMAWDFAEGNPFADGSGSLRRMADAVCKARRSSSSPRRQVTRRQADAIAESRRAGVHLH